MFVGCISSRYAGEGEAGAGRRRKRPLDVHGNLDITVATNRVTGGGLLLYPSGSALTQINAGLSFDLYKDPTGFINGISVYGGIWNEFWVDGRPLGARAWQEMDAYAGISVAFAQYWKFSAEYVQFNFPNAIPTAYNSVYTLSYSDAHWGWWFPFNPYVSLFYNMDGGSTVVFGKNQRLPRHARRRPDVHAVQKRAFR